MVFVRNSRIKLVQVKDMNIRVSLAHNNHLRAGHIVQASLTYILVSSQINEMQMVREKVYAMEQAHLALKAKYDLFYSGLGVC